MVMMQGAGKETQRRTRIQKSGSSETTNDDFCDASGEISGLVWLGQYDKIALGTHANGFSGATTTPLEKPRSEASFVNQRPMWVKELQKTGKKKKGLKSYRNGEQETETVVDVMQPTQSLSLGGRTSHCFLPSLLPCCQRH